MNVPVPDWATWQDLARAWQCHPRTVRRWCQRAKIEVFRPTLTSVRVSREQVQRLIEWANERR